MINIHFLAWIDREIIPLQKKKKKKSVLKTVVFSFVLIQMYVHSQDVNESLYIVLTSVTMIIQTYRWK